MAIQTPSALRMSGLNSGLDTEAIVNAMTASTKLRITTEQRKVLKLESQQEAYRSIITAVTEFKEKYFDLLKGDSCLKSTSLFNQYKASTIKADGTEGAPAGVTITSSANATAADYDILISSLATQTKTKGQSLSNEQQLKLSDYRTSTNGEKTYAMKITVGDKTKVISFDSATSDDGVRNNINDALKTAFGTSTASGTLGDGLVKIESNDNRIVSSSKAAISISDPVELTDTVELGTDFITGSNSITITVDGETKTYSFKTISNDYFDNLLVTNADTGLLEFRDIPDTEENAKDLKARQSTISDVAEDMYRLFYEEEYENWKDGDDTAGKWGNFNDMSESQRELVLEYARTINEQNLKKAYDAAAKKEFNDEYKEYVQDIKDANEGVPEDQQVEASSFEDWMDDEKSEFSFDNFKSGALFSEYYDDTAFYKAYEDVQDALNAVDPTDDPDDIERDMNFLMGIISEKSVFSKVYTDGNIGAISNLSSSYTIVDKTYDDFFQEVAADTQNLIDGFNENALKGLQNLTFSNGVTLELSFDRTSGGDLEVSVSATDKNGDPTGFGLTSNSGYDFDLASSVTTSNTVTNSTKLGDLNTGLSSYEFSINGQKFSFSADTTIKEMLAAVNSSDAGVTMSFSTLDNSFSMIAKEYGSGVKIDYADIINDNDAVLQGGDKVRGVLERLGFGYNDDGAGNITPVATTTEGTNMIMEINGASIETTSNSYTLDGTTITVASNTKIPTGGLEMSTSVTRDYSNAISSIKTFVEDYNKLLQTIYKYTDEKPNKDYYFLTDDDKTEMELSESQTEMWEKVAKQGILYNDSLLTGMMSKFRSTLYGSVTTATGGTFGMYNLGITTSSEYWKHGELKLDEAALTAAFQTNADDIMKLFTDPTNGIMQNFDKLLDSYVKTTGARSDKGLLVQKAGVASGTSTNDNGIADQISKLKSTISSLEKRYETQQDRYWSIFSSLEQQMGTLNSQTSYISQMLGGTA